MPDFYLTSHVIGNSYLGIVTILVLAKMLQSSKSSMGVVATESSVGVVKCILVALLILPLFVYRPWNMGDTEMYKFTYVMNYDFHFTIDEALKLHEPGWNVIQAICVQSDLYWLGFKVVVACIYLGGLIIISRLAVPRKEYWIFLFFITGWMFMTQGTNGIRNATGETFALIGMVLMAHRNVVSLIVGIFLMWIGTTIHTSVWLIALAVIGARFVVKDFKLAFYIWIACILLALIFGHTLSEFAANLSGDEHAQEVVGWASDKDMMDKYFSKSGFRLDFIAYSSVPILIGYWVILKNQIYDRRYIFLLNSYIFTNCAFILFMYAAYANRFAMLSWAFLPLMVGYPFLALDVWGDRQLKYSKMALFGNFAYLMFVSFIYY